MDLDIVAELDRQWRKDASRITYVHLEHYVAAEYRMRASHRWFHWLRRRYLWKKQRILLRNDLEGHRLRYIDRLRKHIGWRELAASANATKLFGLTCGSRLEIKVPRTPSTILRGVAPTYMPDEDSFSRILTIRNQDHMMINAMLARGVADGLPPPIPIIVRTSPDTHCFDARVLLCKTFKSHDEAADML